MDNLLPLLYLTILSILLLLVSFFIVQANNCKKTNRRCLIMYSRLEFVITKLMHKIITELGSLYIYQKNYSTKQYCNFDMHCSYGITEDLEGISNLYNTIGFTYVRKQSNMNLAIYYYKEALKNDHDYTVALNNLGYAYEKQKMMSDAIITYEEVIKREPENEVATSRIKLLKRRIPKSG